MKSTIMPRFVWSALALTILGAPGPGRAANAVSDKLPAPIFDGLGGINHPVTTQSTEAQRYFNQGLALLYAFNHAEAIRSFEAVTRLDADCAMGWWGRAQALGPHVNRPMPRDAVPQAWEALQKALSLKAHASAREQALIDALAKRYQPEHVEDRSALDLAFADAMRALARAYPDDPDVGTLFAEALMDTMPWAYWNKDLTPKPAALEVMTVLREVLMRHPDHPGANHFFIHIVEAGPNPEYGLPNAAALGNAVTGAGHLVHMPSHIYVRVGDYHQATEINRRAVVVDREYISQCRAQGFYPGVYYPHNVHFVWFASSLEGRSAVASEAARTVARYALDARCGAAEVPEATRFRHLPQLTDLRFGRWDDVLKVPKPSGTNELIFDQAMWHFCHGMALAAKGQADDAARDLAALDKLLPAVKATDSVYFPASGAAKVAVNLLAGKVAGSRGNKDEMIKRLEQAVAAQDELPYMEPPFWHHPTRQTLAAAWLQAGDAVQAERVFRQSLKDLPRNGWSLYGLAESLRRQGRTPAAEAVRAEFDRAWKHADVELNLAWF